MLTDLEEEEDIFKPKNKVLKRTPVKKAEGREHLSRDQGASGIAASFFGKFRSTWNDTSDNLLIWNYPEEEELDQKAKDRQRL